MINREEIIQKHGYTPLVYDRINKKLSTNYSKQEIEKLVLEILEQTDMDFFERQGKNYYISNHRHNVKLTINSGTLRIITAARLNSPGR